MYRNWIMIFFLLIGSNVCLGIDGNTILKQSDDLLFGGTTIGDITVENYEDGVLKSTQKMIVYQKGFDKMVAFFYYPPQDKKVAALKDGDDVWIYIPTNRRFLRIGSRQSFQGGQFNYSDILNVNYSRDYNGKILQESPTCSNGSCYEVELTAKARDVTYARIVARYKKDNFAPISREYFTRSGRLFKHMKLEDYQNARPMLYIMRNALREQDYSTLRYTKLDINPEIHENIFSRSYIKRRR